MRRFAAILVCFAAVACARQEPARHSPSSEGGRLVRRLESDINTLNYVLQTTDYELYVLNYLYDPLIPVDEHLRPVPGTARAWSLSPDGTAITLQIDPRATFSDGTPVRAADVLFTINKIVDENSPQFSSFFDNYDRTHTAVLDDRTIRVAFREPRASQLYSFNIGVLPEHVYAHGDFKTAFNDKVVGNGPYRLARRDPGREIVLERREDYWREKPAIRSVVFKVIADDATAWAAMKRGDIDEMRVRNDLWFYEKNRPDVMRRMTFRSFYALQYNCIPWNEKDPLFRDARVRRALGMCFDRKSVIDRIYHGQARPLTGPFLPDSWAYDPSVPPLPFDPAGARNLLAQAGWRDTNGDGILDRDGKPFSFDMMIPAGSVATVTQAQVLQDSLKSAGVRMSVTPIDSATFFDYLMKGKYQAAMFAWTADPDPDVYPLFDSKQVPPNGMNVVDYSNPEADRLIDAGRRELDQQKRIAIYHQLHRLLANDQPCTWTVQFATKWAINKRVKNVAVSSGFGLYEWYPGPLAWRLEETH